MTQIMCLSTSEYYPFPTRKQNVMNRIEGAKIIYVNPPVSLIARFKDPKAKEKAQLWKEEPQKGEKENINVYFQPPVFPFFNKRRGINELNQKKLANYLAGLIEKEGFDKDSFILWCYSPTSADVVAPLAKALGIPAAKLWARTVYDCVDRHSAYPGLINPEVVDAMEQDLATACNTVFATAQGLYDRLSQFNDNTHLIPNGANYELFSRTASLKKESDKLRFGFVGMLQECIDYPLLAALAKAFPDAELCFVGRKLPGVDLSVLEAQPNVVFKGLVPQKELPDIIKDFDVCLNVFADNDLSKDVSPLKFYEYLATGKPVVSTPVPLQVRDFEDCIYIGEDEESFIAAVKEALSEDENSPKREERIRRANECSWENRVKEMLGILNI